MTTPTDPAAGRTLATRLFNETWTLLDRPARSSEENRRMLLTACASRLQWEGVGEDVNVVVGDWQIAHVASVLGHDALALEFAAAAHEGAQDPALPDWLRASTHEGLARAHAAAGHSEERDSHIAAAHALLATVDDAEDRELIESQLADIPR